jgi:hypothetical protein
MAGAAAKIPLRDFSIGRVYERAVATLSFDPAATLVLAVLFGALPSLGLEYAMLQLNRAFGPDPALPVLVAQMAVIIVLFGMASSLAQAAFTPAVVAQSQNRRVRITECVVAVVRAAPLLVVLSVATSIAITLGSALLVVPGLLLWVVWAVAVPVLIDERSRIATVLLRSGQLTMGARWSIFGLLLVLFAIGAGSSLVVEVASGEWNNEDIASALSNRTYVALSVLSGMIVNSFYGAVIASLYVELRAWKAGPATETLEQVFA